MTIIRRFIEISKKYPDKTAIIFQEKGYWKKQNYSLLLKEAEAVAAYLSEIGVKKGDPVIIPSVRFSSLISYLLGILWAGGYYVFVDPEYPKERQKFICKQVEAKVGLLEDVESSSAVPNITWHKVPLKKTNISAPEIPTDRDQPAYIMFTSGSTGTAKGVVVPHRAIVRLVVNTDFISFAPQEVFLQLSALSFDASTLELWGPLLNGGTCVLHPENNTLTPALVQKSIVTQSVTTLWLTSSLFNTIISEHPEVLKSVKQLLIGGEALSIAHIKRGLKILSDTHLFNGYGPTENTTFTTVYPIPRTLPENISRVPIGFPIHGTYCELFDKNLMPVTAANTVGELIAFGDGLAIGYLNQPKLTAEKFIEIRCADGTKRKGYRTGDLAIKNLDGSYDFLQRNDEQVKIDGHRIEPGEIELFLNDLDDVVDARVIVRIGSNGQKRLTAYVVGKLDIQKNELRTHLSLSLPHYMVPHFIIIMPTLPKNQNGKLDESQLPDPFADAVEQRTDRHMVADCWEEVLGRRVSENENFLDAGGTSLEALRLATLLEKRFSTELSATFVFEYPTIGNQINYFYNTLENHILDKRNLDTPNTGEKVEFAIIGMACRFPGAKNLNEYWQNLLEGKETVSFFSDSELSAEINPAERNHSSYVKAKGIIEDYDKFDASFFGISPIEADIMDPQQRILLELCWHALEDAGIPPGDDKWRTGVFVGKNWARYYQQYVLPNKELIHKFGVLNSGLANESDLLSTRISYKLNLKGPSLNIFTACSTGLVTVAQACEAIEQGQCEQALAGGSSICTPVKSGYLYQEGSMLSKDGHCRPFDAAAAGTTFNDGAGVVVIKRRDLAEQDGDRIYAVIKGFAVNNDGEQKASFTAPSVGGQVAVYNAALKRAGIDPRSVGFIETHGTATPLGDPIEVLSLRKSYAQSGNEEKTCVLGSVKSNIGHTIHAAGIASLIKTTLAVRHNTIPPTLFFEKPNPKLKFDGTPFFVNNSVVSWPITGPRRAAVSSLGVGGTNAHVLLEEYPDSRLATDNRNHPAVEGRASYSVLLSGKTEAALERQINSYHQFFLDHFEDVSLRDSAYTTFSGRRHFSHRAVASGRNLQKITQQLVNRGNLTRGKTFNCSDSKIGFTFSGQGAQRVAMGQWLYEHDSDFRKLFDLGCDIVLKKEGFDIRTILFTNPDSSENVAAVNQTRITQPALFLLEYGLAQHLIQKGCRPDFLIGHSIGEFSAAALAGVFQFEDAIALVARRGTLMQSMSPGKMLVVKAAINNIQEYLSREICLAAINAPTLTVLSGPADKIQEVEHLLTDKKIPTTLLQTSHAFHSHMMEPIVSEFANYVANLPKNPPTIPIISTMTGKLLSAEEAVNPSYWAAQLRHPVLFSDAVMTAIGDSSDSSIALVEIGPGATLTNLVNYHPKLKNVLAIATLPGSGTDEKTVSELDECINNLWIKGFSIAWHTHYSDHKANKISLPGYPFSPDLHWLTPPDTTATHRLSQPLGHLQQTANQNTQVIKMNPEEHFDHIQHQLVAILEDVTGYDLSDIKEEAHFSEVGLDSLLLTQIATAIDRQFDIGITFRHLVEEYTCLKELVAFIADKVPVKTTSTTSPEIETPQVTGISPGQTAIISGDLITTTGNPLQDLVNAQLHIMQLQLQAFSGPHSTVMGTVGSAAIPSETVSSNDKKSVVKTEENTQQSSKTHHTPGTRISKEILGINLSKGQRSWIDDLLLQYQHKFSNSKAYTQKYRKKLADPRSVSGFNPQWKEIIFPIVTEKSKGSKLWDIDGNELIDTSNGFGPIFFGHSPDFITNAIKEQLDKGIETGPQSPIAGEVAELFCELTGNERCSFASTGSEAVIGAIRLARTVTGRSKVVMFEGAYHGIFDEVLNRPGREYQALPAAPGIPREATSNMLVLPWGEQESLETIKELGKELAAVLVESVQSRKPEFHSPEYIKSLRDITAKNDTALILDEVVTGFRVHPGGIRKRFDIDADLATYGKVAGGGFPIGIIGGKAKFMDALDGGFWQYGDTSIPECGVTFFAGTFVRHPLSLVAAKAMMERIKAEGMPLYERLEAKTTQMANKAKIFIANMETEVKFEEFASLFYVSVPTSAHWGHLLFLMMTLEGIHIQQYRPNFLTTEHSVEDVDKILMAFKKSLAELILHGLIKGNEVAAKKYLSNNRSIPAGARLGKNANGEPAYFIEDPNKSGNYIEVGAP